MSCADNGLPCDDFNQDGNHDIFDILGMVRCVLIGWSDDTACTGSAPVADPAIPSVNISMWPQGGELWEVSAVAEVAQTISSIGGSATVPAVAPGAADGTAQCAADEAAQPAETPLLGLLLALLLLRLLALLAATCSDMPGRRIYIR